MGSRGSAAAAEEEDSGAELVLARGSAALVGGGGENLIKMSLCRIPARIKIQKVVTIDGNGRGGYFLTGVIFRVEKSTLS